MGAELRLVGGNGAPGPDVNPEAAFGAGQMCGRIEGIAAAAGAIVRHAIEEAPPAARSATIEILKKTLTAVAPELFRTIIAP